MKPWTWVLFGAIAGCNAAEPARLPVPEVPSDAAVEDARGRDAPRNPDDASTPAAKRPVTATTPTTSAAGWWCARAMRATCEGICTREEVECTTTRAPDAGPCGADAYSPCKPEARAWCVDWIEPMVWQHRTKCAATREACEKIRAVRDERQRGLGAPPGRDITDCVETP